MGKIYDALKRAEKEAQGIINKNLLSDTASSVNPNDSTVGEYLAASDNKHLQKESGITEHVSPETKKVSDLKLVSGNLAQGSIAKEQRGFSFQNILTRKNKFNTKANQRYLPTINDPHSVATEQYRILRSRIIGFCEQHNIRTLLVTSSIPGEGKSTVASNLAVSIANGINDHALLIDSDLRKPTIHNSFSLNNNVGLSTYLSRNIPLTQILHKSPIEKLTILPAGTGVHNPSELLSSRKMIELIHEIKNRYDDRYIIFDSTPIQQTPEPVALSKHIDGIIFVVRAGVTNRELVKRSVASLDKNKIIGLVFNMVQDRIKSNYYNYYYSQKT